MVDNRIKTFTYRCTCGYTVNVYVDFGKPQEFIACKKCRTTLKREII